MAGTFTARDRFPKRFPGVATFNIVGPEIVPTRMAMSPTILKMARSAARGPPTPVSRVLTSGGGLVGIPNS